MRLLALLLLLSFFACSSAPKRDFNRAPAELGDPDSVLEDGWRIQSSQVIHLGGDQISQPEFVDSSWYPARIPSTVLGNLVDDSAVLPPGNDPFFGMNLNHLLGLPTFSPVKGGTGIFLPETPADSLFGQSWWYRREFSLPSSTTGSNVEFTLNGITYGADVWVNGTKIAQRSETLGSYREFHWEIAPYLKSAGSPNSIAVQVWPPAPHDLSTTWVDWNISPQDKNMGLWRGASLRVHGPVEIAHPLVVSTVSKPNGTYAALEVEAIFTNSSDQPVSGDASGEIEGIHFSKKITLEAHESQTVSFSSVDFPELKMKHPCLWWPAQMGLPSLYHLKMEFQSPQIVSTQTEIDFGIRQVTSDFNAQGARQFYINGKPLLIRGGGWAPDLFMRYTTARIEKEMNYVLDMGLNTIRQEGTLQPDSFYSLADRKGVLVMPGITCCNAWQMDTMKWNAEQRELARVSVRDMLLSLRSHPSVFTFLYGSDDAPEPPIEQMYLAEIKAANFPNPVVASATKEDEDTKAKTGVKMNGPYDYVPPSYWLTDKKAGGAFGFNTETSPGPSIPPMQSLKKFLPPQDLDHVDSVWGFHAGANGFNNIRVHTQALEKTYGPIQNMGDMVEKSQLMDYDSHRAMFEAFNRNKDRGATGIIQWMLNNAFPSVIWHLYDYYLQPGAAYFGTKEANRPLHLIYGYDDHQVSLVNSTYKAQPGLHAKALIYDLDSHLMSSQEAQASSQPNDTQALFPIKRPSSTQNGIYFVKLELTDAQGTLLDSNFYWLSMMKPKLPLKVGSVDGDFSALSSMTKTQLKIDSSWDFKAGVETVELTNPSDKIALFINLRLTHGTEQTDLLPVIWDDNDISLLPGEHRTLKASLPDPQSSLPIVERPEIHGMGWNVPAW